MYNTIETVKNLAIALSFASRKIVNNNHVENHNYIRYFARQLAVADPAYDSNNIRDKIKIFKFEPLIYPSLTKIKGILKIHLKLEN